MISVHFLLFPLGIPYLLLVLSQQPITGCPNMARLPNQPTAGLPSKAHLPNEPTTGSSLLCKQREGKKERKRKEKTPYFLPGKQMQTNYPFVVPYNWVGTATVSHPGAFWRSTGQLPKATHGPVLRCRAGQLLKATLVASQSHPASCQWISGKLLGPSALQRTSVGQPLGATHVGSQGCAAPMQLS